MPKEELEELEEVTPQSQIAKLMMWCCGVLVLIDAVAMLYLQLNPNAVWVMVASPYLMAAAAVIMLGSVLGSIGWKPQGGITVAHVGQAFAALGSLVVLGGFIYTLLTLMSRDRTSVYFGTDVLMQIGVFICFLALFPLVSAVYGQGQESGASYAIAMRQKALGNKPKKFKKTKAAKAEKVAEAESAAQASTES
ncbi:hypothetical protein BK816_01520 [Boudabousia tangfeifanii]|uniref:Uncharacterized protein n=1 Tax=Boudabousia tangfeifanii TaxID=1912795 RepID=A0A1D9MIN1_9ACTO|nr:hypothetical protein [Boudabousia tangfeifanii]AOZ72136.1 hypothetical protein BK816_01520 [Boudabousia tangfeifanii]